MAWIFAGVTPADEGNPPAGIGAPKGAGAIGGFPGTPTVEVGGQSAANLAGPARLTSPKTIITSINPFTGKKEHLEIMISSADPKTGEAVFKFSKKSPSGIAIDLGKLLKD